MNNIIYFNKLEIVFKKYKYFKIMSNNYNRNPLPLLPKINPNIKISNNLYKPKNRFSQINAQINQKEIINSLKISKEKKPGTSINTKKPLYILPQIQVRKLAKTANNINDNNNKQNENQINIMQSKDEVYYHKYGNIAMNLLESDEELNKMYNELYGNNSEENKKKWMEENLFKREVFWTLIELYIKKNMDINKFIIKEIRKILQNKILDNTLAKSLKRIQFQYNEYMNNIHNF